MSYIIFVLFYNFDVWLVISNLRVNSKKYKYFLEMMIK